MDYKPYTADEFFKDLENPVYGACIICGQPTDHIRRDYIGDVFVCDYYKKNGCMEKYHKKYGGLRYG